ncbi:MAG: hypothetical protein EBT13_17220 [Rhodobacteraceae bacterium]|nr:hypothetical protein [Paracoccaceae bacterium]
MGETEMDRTYYIDIQDQTPNGGRFLVQYSASEMAEMFDDTAMASLAAGDTVTKGLSRYTDVQAFMDSRI